MDINIMTVMTWRVSKQKIGVAPLFFFVRILLIKMTFPNSKKYLLAVFICEREIKHEKFTRVHVKNLERLIFLLLFFSDFWIGWILWIPSCHLTWQAFVSEEDARMAFVIYLFSSLERLESFAFSLFFHGKFWILTYWRQSLKYE